MKKARNLLLFAVVSILLAGAVGKASAERPLQVPLNQALVLEGGDAFGEVGPSLFCRSSPDPPPRSTRRYPATVQRVIQVRAE